jgi:hypothetical protein
MKLLVRSVVWLFIILLFIGCENISDNPKDIDESPGSMKVTIQSDLDEGDVEHYRITMEDSQQEMIERITSEDEEVFTDLAAGTYKITVQAYNDMSEVIAEGEGSVDVEPGKEMTVSVTLVVIHIEDPGAPPPPSRPNLKAEDDTGISDTDNITNRTTLLALEGTSEAFSQVILSDSQGVILITQADLNGNWSGDISKNEGTYTIVATAMDSDNNVSKASEPLILTIDTSCLAPEELDLDADDDKGKYSDDNITCQTSSLTITGEAEMNADIIIYEAGTQIDNAHADDSGNFRKDMPVLTRGSHSITAAAIDPAGNVSPTSGPLVITIDTVNPTVNAGNDIDWDDEVKSINGSAADSDSGIDTDTVSWTKSNGAISVSFGSPSSLSSTVSGSANEEGEATLRLSVTDIAGNTGYDELNFRWDDRAPAVNAGSDVGWRKTTCTLAGSASDGGSGLASTSWSRYSGNPVTFGNTSSLSCTVSGNNGEEGAITLRLTATDTVGNSRYDDLIFRWDAKAPSVNAGTDIAWRRTSCSLAGSASDGGSGLSSTTWSGSNVSFSNRSSLTSSVSGNTGEEGAYTITLTAVDNLNNSASDSLVFRWDNKAPGGLSLTLNNSRTGNCDFRPESLSISFTDGGSGRDKMLLWCFDTSNVKNYYSDGSWFNESPVWISYSSSASATLMLAYYSVSRGDSNGGTGTHRFQGHIKVRDAVGNESVEVPSNSVEINYYWPCTN